jgi:eukaryotic-like serine/threonine-protein kinase
MSLSRFLTSRTFLIQLILAAVFVVVLLVLTMKGLENYTRHGQSNPVPDFSGLVPAEAKKIAEKNNMKVKVVDSLFLEDAAPGTVVDQIPVPGHGVKQNRTIFLTINSTLPEMVTLPQLTDISFRQAQVLAENAGLQIGEISYHPSEFNNLVLSVKIDSAAIFPGKQLPKGTRIDLVIGRQLGNQATLLPDLTGLTIAEAQLTLTNAMLNTGVIIFDESVVSGEDSINAQIWRQRPDPKVTITVLTGTSVDLWATVDQLKIDDEPGIEFQ